MSPYLRLISWWCLQGLQLNCCVLTRRKNGPIETALSGHATAVLRVILTKETVCVACLLYILSALAASRRLTKTHERNFDKHLPNSHSYSLYCASKSINAPRSSHWSKWDATHCTSLVNLRRWRFCDVVTRVGPWKNVYREQERLSYWKGRCHVPSTSAHHDGERYFLTSLHCFAIRKTSINAAGPADCCVSTTVQLVMYTYWVGDVPRAKLTTQLNSTVAS